MRQRTPAAESAVLQPHADPRFSSILHPLPCRAFLERAWYTRSSWCFLWKPPLLSFFTRSVVNTPRTGVGSLPPAVSWECPGQGVSYVPPLARCCFVYSSKFLLLKKKIKKAIRKTLTKKRWCQLQALLMAISEERQALAGALHTPLPS